MPTFEIEDREVLKALTGFMSALQDPSPAMQGMAEDIRGEVDLAFSEGRSPAGERWEPLQPATIAQRPGNSSQPLRDTGRLANSIMAAFGSDYAVVGTNVEYAGFHQLGTRDIPARPYIPLAEDLAGGHSDLVLDAVFDHLERALG
jgi:phage virion morphogenesis protein